MAKKGCGLLLFVSVVVFSAGAAFVIVAAVTIILLWLLGEKVAPHPVFLGALFWGAPLLGGVVGIFWARAMLKSDTK